MTSSGRTPKLKMSLIRFAEITLLLSICASASITFAADEKERGTVIQEATIYVAPDASSQRLGTATRGRDIYVMEHSNFDKKPWAHVLVVVQVNEATGEGREISGWVDGGKVVSTATPNADQIIFGEAVDSENQAEQRGGRRHAAEDAMRLYYRLYEYFPNSPLAGESLWRFADIRWQLEKAGIVSRPSYRRLDPDARSQMDEEALDLVGHKFPRTKWADLASYDKIDNKICGSWKGEAKCPEKEAEIYEKYAREHPQSPKVSEALYNAAWRMGALINIYKSKNENDKSERARRKAVALAQEIATQNSEGDWKPRALDLIYKLEQGIPITEDAALQSAAQSK